jgi:hypothetical protein
MAINTHTHTPKTAGQPNDLQCACNQCIQLRQPAWTAGAWRLSSFVDSFRNDPCGLRRQCLYDFPATGRLPNGYSCVIEGPANAPKPGMYFALKVVRQQSLASPLLSLP